MAEDGKLILSDWVNEATPDDKERYHGAASDEHKNLIALAKLGPERIADLLVDKIGEEHLQDDAVGPDHLQDDAVGGPQVQDGVIGSNHLTAALLALIGAGPKWGHMYMSDNSTSTTITVGNTYYKANGTTTAGLLNGFTMPSSNRLTYGGTDNVVVLVAASHRVEHATGGPNNVSIRLAKNGTTLSSSTFKDSWNDSANYWTYGCLVHLIEMSTNDYLEFFFTTSEDSATLTLKNLQFVAVAFKAP